MFQIEGVNYIRVVNLRVTNSHDAGFTIKDSSNIDLINNTTHETLSSGIQVWYKATNIRILGNTITKATTWDLEPSNMPKRREAPHEALSVGGAVDFEVAYNNIYDCDKEGIDIKGTSTQGKVHHNVVHDLARQGIYVDAWFGPLRDIEIYSNVVFGSHMSGIALSAENGPLVDNINIHNNVIFNNDGSGLYFSRWSANNLRQNIQIQHNTFYHNGYGTPKGDQPYYWMTGGLYLYSANLRDITIADNIFSKNDGFQIGYSDLYTTDGRSWPTVAAEKGIHITGNLIDGANNLERPLRVAGIQQIK